QIGMASRELKDSEIANGLTPIVIATDGIVVIVNNDNPIEGITSEEITSVFKGETREWNKIGQ
ncbi:MAG: phosphate ABC transporter substrate-binding protein, partial [Clostridiaceae bacterium]|nr:phosphate ABC transporter substrate-binding protein [Clostridiaceae bacterium]